MRTDNEINAAVRDAFEMSTQWAEQAARLAELQIEVLLDIRRLLANANDNCASATARAQIGPQ